MNVLDWMLPRDHRAAARSVSTLCAVAAAVTIVFAPFQPTDRAAGAAELAIGGGVIALVVVLALLARYFQEANRVAWSARSSSSAPSCRRVKRSSTPATSRPRWSPLRSC